MRPACLRERWRRSICWRGLGGCWRRGFWRTVTFLLLLELLAMDMQCGGRTWRRLRRGVRGVKLVPAVKLVEVRRSISVGENFVPRGAEARAGQLLLDRGRRLDHAGIAIAASVGKRRVEVFRKPREIG